MKILMINLPYMGHVIPTIGLVQQLIANNCEVSYLLPFDWEDVISNSGAKFIGYNNHRHLSEQIKNAYAMAQSVIEEVDLIVYEQFFFLGKHLAERYNKPAVRIFTAPATNKELMDQFISKGPLSIFKIKWIAKAFTKDIAKDVLLKTENWLDEIVENPPDLNLVYTLRELQPFEETFDKSLYCFLGPSIYQRPKMMFNYKKGKYPLVYISLGTVIKNRLSFYQMCIDTFAHEKVDVILSIGKNVPISKLKNNSSNIHVYDFVPQTEVLSMTDVFVTHGGMNSISEALVHRVPMVVLPMSSDQPVNANTLVKKGVARQLNYSTLNAKLLKSTVFSVLNDLNIKMNLNELYELILNSLGNRGGALRIIDYYQQIKRQN